MLTHLSISNYTLIDRLDIEFHNGFSAITGETGAGKSILLDALDLVLGKRAESQVLLDSSKKCVVEASFVIGKYNLGPFFLSNSLDYDEECILRREIHPNGKSRAFINDTPVTLLQMKALGDQLVDIHAQHATTSLQDPLFQLSVLDGYANLNEQLHQFRERFMALRNLKDQKEMLMDEERKARTSMDYRQFLFDELNAAALQSDEQESLEERLKLVSNAEEIKNTLYFIQGILNEDDNSILNQLTHAESQLNKIEGYYPPLKQIAERLRSNLIDIKDINLEISRLDEDVEFSQELMNDLQARLDLIYKLQHKHQVTNNGSLIEIQNTLKQQLESFTSLEEKINETGKQILAMESALDEAASLLTAARRKTFPELEKEILGYLRTMGMPDAQFEIRWNPSPEMTIFGRDNIEFYFNANLGHSLKPLSEIASGGELSRVMLAIKTVLSGKKSLPTIIFDEIDSGLSGDIAGKVGDVMRDAAKRIQIITVTHLPQIAGKARHHYSVFKSTARDVTFSNIKYLDDQERITELAKLIGGRETTDASMAAAKELIN